MANARTAISKRYQEKVGLISKSYKLKREVVDAYAIACKEAGVSASGQLTAMMQEFIQSVSESDARKESL